MYQQEDLVRVLQAIPWFHELKAFHIEKLADIAHIRNINAGEELFAEGSKEDYLYIIIEGQIALEMFVPTRGNLRIFTGEALDILGWSTLTPVVRYRTSSARALVPSRVIGLDADGLKRLCEEDHEFGYVIMKRVANVVASRYLTMRLQLLDVIAHTGAEELTRKSYLE